MNKLIAFLASIGMLLSIFQVAAGIFFGSKEAIITGVGFSLLVCFFYYHFK